MPNVTITFSDEEGTEDGVLVEFLPDPDPMPGQDAERSAAQRMGYDAFRFALKLSQEPPVLITDRKGSMVPFGNSMLNKL